MIALRLQVTSILSLAAACASAGVTIVRDLHYCKAAPYFPRSNFQISIAFAFVSWFLLAISSHVMFWLFGNVRDYELIQYPSH